MRRALLTLAALLGLARSAAAEGLEVGLLTSRTFATATGWHRSGGQFHLLERALAEAPDLDILIGPEWFFVPPGGVYSAREYAALRRALAALSAGREVLLVPGTIARTAAGKYRNTALALDRGDVLLEYDKRTDGGDTRLGADVGLAWQHGRGAGTFSWRGHAVGLEVCMDHSVGVLRLDEVQGLDLQIVVSAGVTPHLKNVQLRRGGHLLLTNGWRRTSTTVGRYTDRAALRRVEADVHPIDDRTALRRYRIETGVAAARRAPAARARGAQR